MNDKKCHVSFHDILRDIASNFASAETFLPSKVLIRGASVEKQNDKLYDGRCMLANGSLAVDPRQSLFVNMTKTITFWLPFEQDGPLYTIEVQAERWDDAWLFDCLFRPPTRRIDDDQVCYNGGSLQRYRMVWTAGRLKAMKNPESYHDSNPPAPGAFTHMVDMFVYHVNQSPVILSTATIRGIFVCSRRVLLLNGYFVEIEIDIYCALHCTAPA